MTSAVVRAHRRNRIGLAGPRRAPRPKSQAAPGTCKDGRDGRIERNAGLPAGRRAARRRAGDAAGAVLRPRLRARDHPVHGADVPPPDLVGAGPGPAGAGDAVVGVGRLRLADQRHRPRGGRGPARHVRRDGGAADRLALRARGLRQPRPALRALLRRRADRPHRPLHARQPRGRRAAPLGARPRRQHRDRRRPAGRGLLPRRPRAGRAVAARPPPRHGRALLLRLGGVEAGPRPLRRAPRADRDHRPRRVDRRDRRRRRRPRDGGDRGRGAWGSR